MRILLLGGTGEARELAQLLVANGIDVISSLAGRTTNAHHPPGQVRIGGFGGATGLTAWLQANPVDAVIDATHPFATQITKNATQATRNTSGAPAGSGRACETGGVLAGSGHACQTGGVLAGSGHACQTGGVVGGCGVPLLVLRRPGWSPGPGDNWHWADTVSAAAELLPRLGSRAFLTIGRQGLDSFATTGLWTLARCVDPPDPAPNWCTLILARGPFTLADELTLMRNHHIDVLVTKDSGGNATAAKLTAARELAIPVIVIRRPLLPNGIQTVESVAQAAEWVLQAKKLLAT
ncbi:MAG TPA: precorrin-6A/cobalt-precorrin-6A reductase [Kribbella sp.]